MGLSDREYMLGRYRKRGGAKALLIWREAKGRLEFEQQPIASGRTARALVHSMRGRRPANSKALMALGVATVLYLVIAKPFGGLIVSSGVPETGEFGVAPPHASGPTGQLSFVAGNDNLKIYLFDTNDNLNLVGYVRAGEIGEFQIPVGHWRLATAPDETLSIKDIRLADRAQPIGVIEVKERQTLTISPVH